MQKTIKFLISIFIFIQIFSIKTMGQECGTDALIEQMLSDSTLTKEFLKSEKGYRDFMQLPIEQKSVSNVTIPVVFHVVYDGADWFSGLNEPSDYSETKAQTMVGLLNNAGFPANFTFELAKTNFVDGREISNHNQYDYDLYTISRFNTNLYLNIWIVNDVVDLEFTKEDGTDTTIVRSAYATFSAYNGGIGDGIVLEHNHHETTLIHEVGHYFNVFHTFQNFDLTGESDDNTTSNVCTLANPDNHSKVGDLVEDTYPTLISGYGATELFNICDKDNGSDCSMPYCPDGITCETLRKNYMCYTSNLSCRQYFSDGQKDRMQHFASYHRNQLGSVGTFPSGELTLLNPYGGGVANTNQGISTNQGYTDPGTASLSTIVEEQYWAGQQTNIYFHQNVNFQNPCPSYIILLDVFSAGVYWKSFVVYDTEGKSSHTKCNSDFHNIEWTIPFLPVTNVTAKIKILSIEDFEVLDESNLFVINSGQEIKTILVEQQDASAVNISSDINFSTSSPLNQVDILLSTDGGNSYNYTIESGYNYSGTSGTYDWTINNSAFESNQAQIKVVESANPDVSGVSNWFPIYPDYPPPANDLCSGAFTLSANGSCAYERFKTTDATDSNTLPTPSCATYNGKDVWFAVTIPESGELTIETSSVTAMVNGTTLGFSDAAMEAYEGSCSSLTSIACNDNGNGQMPAITLTNRTAGETVYLRFWVVEVGTSGITRSGSFDICVYDSGENSSTPNCFDGIQNGSETGVDCGGSCNSCCGSSDCSTDLIVYSFSTSTSVSEVAPGGTIALQTRIRNQGSSIAYGSTLRYFFSEDAFWDSSDIEFASSDYISSLNPSGLSSTQYSSGQIPYGIDGGTYYIIFVADADNTVAESDETNNYYAIPIFVYCSGIVVTNTNDSGPGSLREAIDCANASPGANRITFNFSSGTPPYIINIGQDGLGELPYLSDEGTSIDASAYNLGDVVLDGSALPASNFYYGLWIYASYSSVYGLTIRDFPDDGIRISSGANYVRIGDYEKGNNVYGNGWGTPYGDGISCFSDNIIIQGNNIGTDHNSTPFSDQRIGVAIWSGSENITIGGTSLGEGNVISSNDDIGIASVGGQGISILGNKIGTNSTGTIILPNERVGIDLDSSTDIYIGESGYGRNIISGNERGVEMTNNSNVIFENNAIGTDDSGTIPLPNNSSGIAIFDGTNKDIHIEENLISFNNGSGIVSVFNDSLEVVMTRNSISCNEFGVGLGGTEEGYDYRPVYTTITTNLIEGTTLWANAIIELFYTDEDCINCEGKIFIGSTVSDNNGNWSFTGNFPYNSRIATTATLEHTTDFSCSYINYAECFDGFDCSNNGISTLEDNFSNGIATNWYSCNSFNPSTIFNQSCPNKEDYIFQFDSWNIFGNTPYRLYQYLDLTNYTSVDLQFDLAYSVGYSNFQNVFDINISEDCGTTFNSVYHKEAYELRTSTDYETSQAWEPDGCDDWRIETIDLTAYAGQKVLVEIMFSKYEGGNIEFGDYWGQNLYLDNMKLIGETGTCPPTLYIPNTIPGGLYEASNDVYSDGNVAPNSNTTFHAENYVELQPNFDVPLNTQFTIDIQPCGTPPVVKPTDSNTKEEENEK